MEPGEHRQPSHDFGGRLADLRVPPQLELTPSQMTALVSIEYSSDKEVEDAQLELALRRLRGRPDQGEARTAVMLATGVLAVGLLALLGEGSISMKVGREKKLGLFPVARVMVAKRGETSFPSGSLERELSSHVESKPRRAYEPFRSWLSPSTSSGEDLLQFVIATIDSPDMLEGKIEEARPYLPTWCEQLGAVLTTDLGRKLRLEASGAMRAGTSKGPDIIDVSSTWP